MLSLIIDLSAYGWKVIVLSSQLLPGHKYSAVAKLETAELVLSQRILDVFELFVDNSPCCNIQVFFIYSPYCIRRNVVNGLLKFTLF